MNFKLLANLPETHSGFAHCIVTTDTETHTPIIFVICDQKNTDNNRTRGGSLYRYDVEKSQWTTISTPLIGEVDGLFGEYSNSVWVKQGGTWHCWLGDYAGWHSANLGHNNIKAIATSNNRHYGVLMMDDDGFLFRLKYEADGKTPLAWEAFEVQLPNPESIRDFGCANDQLDSITFLSEDQLVKVSSFNITNEQKLPYQLEINKNTCNLGHNQHFGSYSKMMVAGTNGDRIYLKFDEKEIHYWDIHANCFISVPLLDMNNNPISVHSRIHFEEYTLDGKKDFAINAGGYYADWLVCTDKDYIYLHGYQK
jgi:hypothetical protein